MRTVGTGVLFVGAVGLFVFAPLLQLLDSLATHAIGRHVAAALDIDGFEPWPQELDDLLDEPDDEHLLRLLDDDPSFDALLEDAIHEIPAPRRDGPADAWR